MTLIQKEWAFAHLFVELLQKAHELGYQVTIGEVWRSPETCALYAKEKKGIANSEHINRLAADINLFKDGTLLAEASDYEPLGVFWESLSTKDYECCWGGRFHSVDAYHFSIEHNGVK